MAALPATPVLAAWLFGAAVASALGTALMLGYGRRRLLDQPGQRRSHATPTPRGGGLGPVLAWCAALFALAGAGAGGTQALLLAIGTLAVAAIGLVDDHRPLPAWPRLLVHAAAAVLLVAGARGLPASATDLAGSAALVLALVALVNFWNFMDGIDGLAAMQSAFVAFACGVVAVAAGAPALALAAMLLCASVAGFLPFNTPRARIFLGDVGSGALGFACGGLLLFAWDGGAMPWPIAPLLASAFLLDAGLTLARRMLGGRRWYTAHREHLYQWLVRRGRSHARVAALYLGWNLLIVTPLAVAVLLHHIPPLTALAAATAGGALLWWAARHALLRGARRYGAAP